SLIDRVQRLYEGLFQLLQIHALMPLTEAPLWDSHQASLIALRKPWEMLPSAPEVVVEIQQTFSEGSKQLLQTFLKENITLLGYPSGKFALLLLGSSSRNDRLPYSDIELALMYEANKDQDSRMRGYLYILLSLLELSIIRLGETQDFN